MHTCTHMHARLARLGDIINLNALLANVCEKCQVLASRRYITSVTSGYSCVSVCECESLCVYRCVWVCVHCICIAVSCGLIELIYYNCNATDSRDRQTDSQADKLDMRTDGQLDRRSDIPASLSSTRSPFNYAHNTQVYQLNGRRWLN